MRKKRSFLPIIPLFLLICGGLISCDRQDMIAIEEEETPKQMAPDGGTDLSLTEAKNVATLFASKQFGASLSSRSLNEQNVSVIRNEDGEPLAYVVNTEGNGWVIISATKTYHPILAYSDDTDSKFNLLSENINGGLEIWLDDVKKEIEASEFIDSVTAKQIALEWEEYLPTNTSSTGPGLPTGNSPEAIKCRERLKELNETYYKDGWSFYTLPNVRQISVPSSVYELADYIGSPYEYTIMGVKDVSLYINSGPFLTTTWSQENGFNEFCPNQYKAGCVPVAMAQIMNYHRHPDIFDWDNMKDNEPTSESQYLIASIGLTIGTKYGEDTSSSTIDNACKGFKSYGYEATIKNSSVTDLLSEISGYRRPVFMVGKSSGKGHAWVCDGIIRKISEFNYYVEYLNSCNEYTNYGETLMENPGSCGGESYLRLHMNWGWENGYENGWYLNPTPADRDYSSGRKNMYVRPLK